MNVAFVTFGCRLNRAEALDLEARTQAEGHIVVDLDSGTVPDLIIVRGCSVTAKAQRDCEKAIEHLRQRFPTSQIVPTGCLPSARENPLRTQGPVPSDSLGSVPSDSLGSVPMGTSRAYLKIQDGCNGKCAFCIVPHFRGPSRSVPFADVLARARAFLAADYRELVVTGCNLALYQSGGQSLPDLLAALAELGTVPHHRTELGTVPRHRVRLGSLEPGICDADLLDVFEKHPNICRFIHLSLQSGSNRILKSMRRPYAIERVAAFCTAAVQRLGPRLSLGADVIAGFPGETEEDHARTKQFLSRNFHPVRGPGGSLGNFTNLHVFPYSERPGTPAATLDGALPRVTRIARAKELEEIGRAQRAAFARSFIGQTVEVCVEQGGDHGWTSEYLPCRLSASAPRRSLVAVYVKDVDGEGNLLA